MSQSLARLPVHLIFSTKHRERWLHDDVRQSLHAYMATVLSDHHCPAIRINSVEDYVHILFLLARTVSLADAVEAVKKHSSRWLKTQSNDLKGFSWQGGYGAFAVSESNVSTVERYIARQAEHHRRHTFQQELRVFNERHRIEFDERYVWD